MAVPVIAAIGATLISILEIFRSLRKCAAFVIAGVVFALFVWIIGIFMVKGYQMRDRVLELGEKADQSFVASFFNVFDKIAYVFPVYELFFAISFYLIFCGTLLMLQWVLQFWDMMPFKDSAGS